MDQLAEVQTRTYNGVLYDNVAGAEMAKLIDTTGTCHKAMAQKDSVDFGALLCYKKLVIPKELAKFSKSKGLFYETARSDLVQCSKDLDAVHTTQAVLASDLHWLRLVGLIRSMKISARVRIFQRAPAIKLSRSTLPGRRFWTAAQLTESLTMGILSMAKINRLLVGKSLVGEGNEVAHIDLIIGPRGSPAESAFAHALTNNKDGFTTLLAVVAPNLLVKPATVLFNKVTIKNATQAVQMFGPAQHGVAMAVADSVAAGVIPVSEADNLFICVGVFIHWDAKDNKKIQDFNYQATKESIARAISGEPTPAYVVAQRNVAKHPFAPN